RLSSPEPFRDDGRRNGATRKDRPAKCDPRVHHYRARSIGGALLRDEWIKAEDAAARNLVVDAREKRAQDLLNRELSIQRQILELPAMTCEELMIRNAKFKFHERMVD